MSQFEYVSNAANGYDAQSVLQNMLFALRRSGDLSIVVKTYRAGDPQALNAGQFYAPFMIQFNDGSRWIIFSTTSCRTDRIKGQQWDADNLKRLDLSIDRAILTYPDDISNADKKAFVKQKEKYDRGLEISRIDDIVSNATLIDQIKCRASDIFYEREETERAREEARLAQESSTTGVAFAGFTPAHSQYTSFTETNDMTVLTDSDVDIGKAYDFNGKAFEIDVASLLSDPKYLDLVKRGVSESDDRKLSCFIRMIETFGFEPSSIVRIEATAKKEVIGLLPSGGQPKTDVLATFTLVGNREKVITISCKRTKRDSVSVHQYTADAFADVLDPENKSLRKLLKTFQYYANAKSMPEENRVDLAKQLKPYLPKLCKWVLGGYGGVCSSTVQNADYLVVYNPLDRYFGVHSINDYTEILLQAPPKAFGTPFGWTYASKQRQHSIQLKLPIIR